MGYNEMYKKTIIKLEFGMNSGLKPYTEMGEQFGSS